ncbi:YdeI/OmpD-associated family protein [Idiomarina ramblicola]|uniref:YdeI/OmpD-associated family protein n=1 Tax=Idiomarina ramblicola TaxID=263724 RepID=UPI001FC9FB4F|nr:YdeI/OmpD-associated family protein [Idiomarina ramblicola]
MSKISGGLVHEMPADLANTLRQKKETLPLWENLTPIARNEFIYWALHPSYRQKAW